MKAMRAWSAIGIGLMRNGFAKLKMIVLAPIASATVSVMTSE